MNTKSSIIIFTFIAGMSIFPITLNPLIAKESLSNDEYFSCCQANWYGNRQGRNLIHDLSQASPETWDAKVLSVNTSNSQPKNFQGTHLIVNTEQETIEVHIAPSWYLIEQEFKILPQDRIVIRGSRITIDGQDAIIASEITKEDRTLLLRDKDGFPLWHWQNRHQQR